MEAFKNNAGGESSSEEEDSFNLRPMPASLKSEGKKIERELGLGLE